MALVPVSIGSHRVQPTPGVVATQLAVGITCSRNASLFEECSAVNRRTQSVLSLAVALAVAACAPGSNETAGPANKAAAGVARDATLPAQPAAPALAGTRWQLIAYQANNNPDDRLTPDDSAKYTLAFGSDGSLNVRLDCNTGNGTWSSNASADSSSGSIQFGPIAASMMLCPPPSLGERLAGDFAKVREFRLDRGELVLALEAGSGEWRWAPMPAESPSAAGAASKPMEEQVRAALRAHLSDTLASMSDESPAPRFAFREVDLNGDGDNEALAYLLGSGFCGTGGCDLLVLQRHEGVMRVLQSFPITRTPVAVGVVGAGGWRDIFRTESGGGASARTLRHGFASGQYGPGITVERMPPEADKLLAEDVSYDLGLPLTK
jgi:heat shock protein HslJ